MEPEIASLVERTDSLAPELRETIADIAFGRGNGHYTNIADPVPSPLALHDSTADHNSFARLASQAYFSNRNFIANIARLDFTPLVTWLQTIGPENTASVPLLCINLTQWPPHPSQPLRDMWSLVKQLSITPIAEENMYVTATHPGRFGRFHPMFLEALQIGRRAAAAQPAWTETRLQEEFDEWLRSAFVKMPMLEE